MTKLYNFSAGPSMLPEPVLKTIQAECIEWRQGMSVMEVSHRGMPFQEVVDETEQRLRRLLQVPDNYHILFIQGGASLQFSMIPMNLIGQHKKVDYALTGAWSKKAIKEAKLFADVNIVASNEDANCTYIPDFSSWQLSDNAAYCHITPNETIHGVEFHQLPCTGNVPLVADMSSTILSRPIDVSKFGLIYAGAQKNIGPSGITLVIVRDDLLQRNPDTLPSMLDYKIYQKNSSLFNTPPTFAWYVVNLVCAWLEEQGGLAAIAEQNHRKKQRLYDYIDASNYYDNPVALNARSWMNVPFTLKQFDDSVFLKEAEKQRLMNLKGHRSVGGMRASIYNAMPEQGVDALINMMDTFVKQRQ